ncbi:hypothetical protein IU436_24290 [Nocardia farcinica]|uniref:hypothetical protein n=1 Tax=Nocardia farcinica TaxID=37329 RepID=UPI001895C62C|nr:hypothetical protein [Nocardia farcinica]MBF6421813.1 hypothetical protein [Nocardia farcinica]MBF6433470.1 hypothetical protein [Nocardia farcinica]MBF6504288.1 hypothetical protein [Nocardia farcinica]
MTSSGEPVDTDAALTLHTTPDGITFIRTAAESWADAAIADGDDPTTAHTAAEQTIVFYTTEPEEGAES